MQERERPTPSILIIVPRERPDLDRSLRQAFGDDTGVHLIADRRRRGAKGTGHAEHTNGDRRHRAERDAALDAGRWVVVPLHSRRLDQSDPDVRTKLFLFCGSHVIACETCQDTYRFGWVRRDDRGVCACPRCGSDLSAAVAAHTATCVFWTARVAQAVERSTGSPLGSVAG